MSLPLGLRNPGRKMSYPHRFNVWRDRIAGESMTTWHRPAWDFGRATLRHALYGRILPVMAALAAMVVAHPAFAIVFQNTTEQTAGLGSGNSILNAEAELIVTLNSGTQLGCSASLLAGGQYLLTAAHCVTGDADTNSAVNIAIDFANFGLSLTATNYIVDPTWNGTVDNGGDLALIQLSSAVTSITGYRLDTNNSAVGVTILLAGYGETGTGIAGAQAGSFGTLYYGTNRYLGVYSNVPSVYDYGFEPSGPDEAIIAPGDSGGASLTEINGSWEIVGVHDFVDCTTNGCTPDSTFGQYGGDTSVYANSGWLDYILPEPATAPLLASGLAGIALLTRSSRSRRRSRPGSAGPTRP